MKKAITYPVPHLLGKVDYQKNPRFRPDGDTIHLWNPVLLQDGRVFPPQGGEIEVAITGQTKPVRIKLKGKAPNQYACIRLEGIDAPEEHYRAMPFELKTGSHEKYFPLDKTVDCSERCQPQWKPATDYLLKTLAKTGWALVLLDAQVVDSHQRVLGYVYASNAAGQKGAFITLDLLKRGLAFPFLFESSREFIPTFLKAAMQAKAAHKGVWRHYREEPLPFSQTYPAPKKHTDEEPTAQAKATLNLPMVFRRVVDAHQLQGLSLKRALQKYDAIDFETGDWVTGERYFKIPINRRIWAQHQVK